MTLRHRYIATCLLSLVGLTGCLNTINAVIDEGTLMGTNTGGGSSLFSTPPLQQSQWQHADGALQDLDGYLAQTGHDMIRVRRHQGAPVVLHQVQMSSDTLYGAYLDEGIPLADVVAVDVPLHPASPPFEWRAVPAFLVVAGSFWFLTHPLFEAP